MIARMNDPAKRHDIFLQAADRLAAKHPKLEFILVGDGPLRPGLEAMAAKLGLGERVIFLGERLDIPAVLAASDISVLPSMSESLSNSIMESMAAGVPVVACRAGGNVELIRDGENGFLVATADAEALAERIDTLVQQPELRKSFGVDGEDKMPDGLASNAFAESTSGYTRRCWRKKESGGRTWCFPVRCGVDG